MSTPTSLDSLKKRLSLLLSIPTHSFRIQYGGKTLTNQVALEAHGVTKGTTVWMMIGGLFGGANMDMGDSPQLASSAGTPIHRPTQTHPQETPACTYSERISAYLQTLSLASLVGAGLSELLAVASPLLFLASGMSASPDVSLDSIFLMKSSVFSRRSFRFCMSDWFFSSRSSPAANFTSRAAFSCWWIFSNSLHLSKSQGIMSLIALSSCSLLRRPLTTAPSIRVPPRGRLLTLRLSRIFLAKSLPAASFLLRCS